MEAPLRTDRERARSVPGGQKSLDEYRKIKIIERGLENLRPGAGEEKSGMVASDMLREKRRNTDTLMD